MEPLPSLWEWRNLFAYSVPANHPEGRHFASSPRQQDIFLGRFASSHDIGSAGVKPEGVHMFCSSLAAISASVPSTGLGAFCSFITCPTTAVATLRATLRIRATGGTTRSSLMSCGVRVFPTASAAFKKTASEMVDAPHCTAPKDRPGKMYTLLTIPG